MTSGRVFSRGSAISYVISPSLLSGHASLRAGNGGTVGMGQRGCRQWFDILCGVVRISKSLWSSEKIWCLFAGSSGSQYLSCPSRFYRWEEELRWWSWPVCCNDTIRKRSVVWDSDSIKYDIIRCNNWLVCTYLS